MTKLEKIWIEENESNAIRIDWNNDRHQRIEIRGDKPEDIIKAMDFAVRLLKSELRDREI
ncbi:MULTISPECIES: hypothetical protein [unclassified Endozoicomonas]|uniref:hypothetical protein n=1 Tax=unclassified Endozoicomonas TaxID=2644528 RepID=UPI0021483E4C|nr:MULTISPECIES: hypothetical protein [unclassified Endozoicomonas]